MHARNLLTLCMYAHTQDSFSRTHAHMHATYSPARAHTHTLEILTFLPTHAQTQARTHTRRHAHTHVLSSPIQCLPSIAEAVTSNGNMRGWNGTSPHCFLGACSSSSFSFERSFYDRQRSEVVLASA